ncbi:MAG: hypothetical protein ACRDZ2_01505 [Ilumatobacteraceae bacterium]
MSEFVNVFKALPAGHQALKAQEDANEAGPVDHGRHWRSPGRPPRGER